MQNLIPVRRAHRVVVGLVSLLLVGFVAGCAVAYAAPAGPAPAGPAALASTVTITNFTFENTTVIAGETVTVKNNDQAPHTLTAQNNAFTTPTIPAGGTATFVAPTVPGNYAIKCNIHSTMSGTLVVRAAGTPSPTASPTASPSPSTPAGPVFHIQNFAFPLDATAPAGSIATIVNDDAAPHTFTAVNGAFTTATIPPGGSVTLQLPTTPGSYALKCNIHSFMMGTLTITARPTASPSTTVTASPSPTPAGPVFHIQNFAFPLNATARAGAVATIVNDDAAPHTFTAVDGSFTTATIPPGTSVTLQLPTRPGNYAIKCNIHSFMMGTLTITAAAAVHQH